METFIYFILGLYLFLINFSILYCYFTLQKILKKFKENDIDL